MFFTESITEPKRKSRFLIRFKSVFSGYVSVGGISAFKFDSSTPQAQFFERSDFTFYVKSVTRPSFNFNLKTEQEEGGISFTSNGTIISPQISYDQLATAWGDIELKMIDLGNGTVGDLEQNINEMIALLGVHPTRFIPNLNEYAYFARQLNIWEYEPIGVGEGYSFLRPGANTNLPSQGYGSQGLSYKDLDFEKQVGESNLLDAKGKPSIDLFDDIDRTIINRLEGKKALWVVKNPYLIGTSFGSSDYSSDDIQEVTLKFKPSNCEHYVFDRAVDKYNAALGR
jgi:hypothetical protein